MYKHELLTVLTMYTMYNKACILLCYKVLTLNSINSKTYIIYYGYTGYHIISTNNERRF